MSLRRATSLCVASIALALFAQAAGAHARPMIELGPLSAADCRKPSVMAKSVDEARQRFGCRQMKIVQHWLGVMLDARSFRATPAQLGDENAPDMHDADKRRQYFFGRYWSTHVKNNSTPDQPCEHECTRAAIEGFDDDLRQAFERLTAVLIASTHPLDVDEGDDGWWELPAVYAEIEDPTERAQMMRDDVNAWIQASGIWVYANTGTWDRIDELKGIGEYDFVLINLINFMYAFKERPDLLTDASIERLIIKRWDQQEPTAMERFKELALRVPAGWSRSNVPFSGQDYERELWFSERLIGGDWPFSETENHVLMTLTHYYLMNQWIANDYRGSLKGKIIPPPGNTIEQWFAYQDVKLAEQVRDVAARPMHSGFFEDNARPYQGYSFHALLALASYAQDPVVRNNAQNALHFLATKFAFQSLDGRRYTPMRRNREYAEDLVMYNRDALAFSLGVLSGAYKWNDSPYGLRKSLADAGACFSGEPDCHWHQYTWKNDAKLNDSLGVNIAANADELSDDTANGGAQPQTLWTAFSGYELPRAVHDFMLDKHGGYYARMMPRYDVGHYFPSTLSNLEHAFGGELSDAFPRYFSGDHAFDGDRHNERTPEFYFAGDGFLNIAGGIYNPYQLYVEGSYIIPSDPRPALVSGCHEHDRRSENYDYLSRPYTVLPEVATVRDQKDVDHDGDTQEIYYKPVGATGEVPFEQANRSLPMMRGDSEDWFKSANIATFKNFSYGYRVRNTGVGLYAMLGGNFPQDIPTDWKPCLVSVDEYDEGNALPAGCPAWIVTTEFEYGKKYFDHARAARFKLYDLRAYLRAQGQTGFYLISARVRKFQNVFWSTRVARGFWEVVPEKHLAAKIDPKDALTALESDIKHGNKEDWFSLFKSGSDKHFKYRLVTSREIVKLDQEYGAVFRDLFTSDEGRVQGILEVQDPDGNSYSKADVFIGFMDMDRMDDLPLIDVKAVEPDYLFTKAKSGDFVYYACARDGWLFVNNPEDGSYLFADSRRGRGFENAPILTTPYFVAGQFADDAPWGALCGYGGGSGWTPAPPDNGNPDQCSDPKLCARPDLVVNVLRVDQSAPVGGAFTVRALVEVQNVGNADAGPFTTRVVFDPGQSLSSDHASPAGLAAGAAEIFDVSVHPGASCFDPTCKACATVDSAQHVVESVEDNNEACKLADD